MRFLNPREDLIDRSVLYLLSPDPLYKSKLGKPHKKVLFFNGRAFKLFSPPPSSLMAVGIFFYLESFFPNDRVCFP